MEKVTKTLVGAFEHLATESEIRRIRYDREAAIRRRLSNLSIEDAPQPTVGPEEAEAIATAVLDTVLVREARVSLVEAPSREAVERFRAALG